jgi:ribosomal protein S27AE
VSKPAAPVCCPRCGEKLLTLIVPKHPKLNALRRVRCGGCGYVFNAKTRLPKVARGRARKRLKKAIPQTFRKAASAAD